MHSELRNQLSEVGMESRDAEVPIAASIRKGRLVSCTVKIY